MDTAPLDLAWEAVNALIGSPQHEAADVVSALKAVERLGGRDPRHSQLLLVAESMLAELRRLQEHYKEQATADVIAMASARLTPTPIASNPHLVAIPTALSPPGMSLRELVPPYKQSPAYQRLKFKSRRNYDEMLRRLLKEHGDVVLASIKAADLKRWHQAWLGPENHVATAHSLMGRLRTLMIFGAHVLEQPECERLCSVFHDMKFALPKRRTDAQRITSEQVRAVIKLAHAQRLHSIALAQAIQFEFRMLQHDVIGEWIPKNEPGDSTITYRKKKWHRGLRWTEISVSGSLINIRGCKVEMREAPLVVMELRRLEEDRPKEGPVVLNEANRLPWRSDQYRTQWRKLARAANIPESVRNMDSRLGRKGPSASQPRKLVGAALQSKVRTACMKLPDEIRDDVVSEMTLAVLNEELDQKDLQKSVGEYVRKYRRTRENPFSTVSLDQPKFDGRSWEETISSEKAMW